MPADAETLAILRSELPISLADLSGARQVALEMIAWSIGDAEAHEFCDRLSDESVVARGALLAAVVTLANVRDAPFRDVTLDAAQRFAGHVFGRGPIELYLEDGLILSALQTKNHADDDARWLYRRGDVKAAIVEAERAVYEQRRAN
jgi:hypothetical protein